MKPEGTLDRGEEHHCLMNRMKPNRIKTQSSHNWFSSTKCEGAPSNPQSKREVVDQAGHGMENPCLISQ